MQWITFHRIDVPGPLCGSAPCDSILVNNHLKEAIQPLSFRILGGRLREVQQG